MSSTAKYSRSNCPMANRLLSQRYRRLYRRSWRGFAAGSLFFEVFRRYDTSRLTQQFWSKNILTIRSIGTSVRVVHSFVLAQGNPVPVVLIAGPMRERIERFNRFNGFDGPQRAIYDLIRTAPHYCYYKCDLTRFSRPSPMRSSPRFANTYIRALYSLLKSVGDSALSSSDILSACIIPLLQIEIAICREDLVYLSREFLMLRDPDSKSIFKDLV